MAKAAAWWRSLQCEGVQRTQPGPVPVHALRAIFSSSPNFYILDEPTNHLDMETIEALAKALNKFRVRLPQ